MNLDQLTDVIWRQMQQEKPRALLIGELPVGMERYRLVREEPYEAVILGQLKPSDLLHMPSEAVCDALLQEIPVYLWPEQPYKKRKTAKALCRELAAAEQHLLQLGVCRLGEKQKLITAQEARRLLLQGRLPEPGVRMTPLARDILEGKET